ncbi:MAG TPA: hypothetical protein VNS58_03545 [Puia sp.]|nr:hypothetical protein [Puia sp.]
MILLLSISAVVAQSRREDIYSDFVFYQKRVALEKDLRERMIGRNFALPLDSNTEDKYLSSCWTVSQFLFATPEVDRGFTTLFNGYDSLSYDTKKALLEAVYAVAPRQYVAAIQAVLEKETVPKLFSMCAVYLFRADTTTENGNGLKIRMAEKFPGYDTLPILQELQNYLSYHTAYTRGKTPDIPLLFAGQRRIGQKVIYSFQRWDRDYSGLAIVQNADGRFVRDGQGRLQVFEQLARSGPDLPYFITNGSTPQGVYSIQGTDVSRTNFIGPTPNLQLLLPFEGSWAHYFQQSQDLATPGQADVVRADGRQEDVGAGAGVDTTRTANASAGGAPGIDSLRLYRELLPPEWREYTPMMEAWTAGRIGRTEIIAHGTTIDPEYFKDRPFYPLTPTMGCLCAKELWNPTSGHLLVSEQFNLVSAFLATPGRKGYLYVIDVDDQHKPVSRAEVEKWVKAWEKR